MSIRNRLLVSTTIATAAMLFASGWTLYALVERSLVAEVDRALVAKVRLLASLVEQEDRQLDLQFEEMDTTEFGASQRGGFLQLGLPDGTVLYLSPSLGGEALALAPATEPPTGQWVELPAAPVEETGEETGEGDVGDPEHAGPTRGRAVVLAFLPRVDDEEDPDEAQPLTMTVARDTRELDATLATLRGLLAIVGVSMLAVAGFVLVGVARHSLRPLHGVSERIEQIDGDDLSTRLDVATVPEELVPVVRRLNRLLGRLEDAFTRERAFSNDVAHELRVPLAGLRTTLEVAAARKRSEEEYTEALQVGVKIAVQLQSMVERLLQLARLEAARSRLGTKPYDLADLALESWEPYTERAEARRLRVDLELQDGLDVSLDRELVGLILRNLFENAVNYADEGGRVHIATSRLNGSTTVLVENSGSRLGEEQAAEATQRFWRGDTARTDAGLHCGLGLALTEKATKALEGRLELRSQEGGDFVAEARFPNGAAGRSDA